MPQQAPTGTPGEGSERIGRSRDGHGASGRAPGWNHAAARSPASADRTEYGSFQGRREPGFDSEAGYESGGESDATARPENRSRGSSNKRIHSAGTQRSSVASSDDWTWSEHDAGCPCGECSTFTPDQGSSSGRSQRSAHSRRTASDRLPWGSQVGNEIDGRSPSTERSGSARRHRPGQEYSAGQGWPPSHR